MIEVQTNPINRKGKNLSLRDADIRALEYLARLDAHENVSAAARKLIDQRMRGEIGRDWETVISTESPKRNAEPEVA